MEVTETLTRERTPAEIKGDVINLLFGHASAWDGEARQEERRGNASRAKMDSLRWGATQLRILASRVEDLPEEVELNPADIDLEATEVPGPNQIPLFEPQPPATNEFVAEGSMPFSSEDEAE